MNKKIVFQKIIQSCRVLVYIVMLLILLMGLYPFIARNLLGIDHPTIFGYSSAVVVSGSMSGSIEVNDIVIIREESSYKVGDIISYESGDSLVTHRITAQKDGKFITKGDANNTADRMPVHAEQIMGRVIYVIPKLGAVISFFSSPAGMGILFIAAFLLIIIPSRKKHNTNGGAADEGE